MDTSSNQPQEHHPSRRRLITVAEAQVRLGMGRTTVLDLARSGAITSVKIGTARRIVESSVDGYIDELIESASVANCDEGREWIAAVSEQPAPVKHDDTSHASTDEEQ